MPSQAFGTLDYYQKYVIQTAATAMMHFDDWGDKFVAHRIREARTMLATAGRIDTMKFVKLTREEAVMLGFKKSNRNEGLFLMPTWVWWFIPIVGTFEGNDGKKVQYNFFSGEPLSNDNTHGLLYYGVRFHPDGSMDRGA